MNPTADKCALVVGGSGGVGGAIARRLARTGQSVALTYKTKASRAEQAVKDIVAAGGRASTHKLDLSDPNAVVDLLSQLETEHGHLNQVVNAAGAPIDQPFISQVDSATFAEVIQSDLCGFFNLLSASLPALRRSKSACIVAITSAGLARHPPGDILSVAPKAGIEAVIRGVAREEGRYGIRANCVALGVIDTGMFKRLKNDELDAQWQEAALRNIALRRFGSSAEVADTVAFLCSSGAGYITGQTLYLDGGYSI